MRILIFSFIALIFLLKISIAEEALLSGETTFEVLGIALSPLCDPNDDFTGRCQFLALYGDLSYLNVKWTAQYSDRTERDIKTECYLNCQNAGRDIDTNCLAYKNSTNYCNYISKTGYGFCTIVNPNYLFKNQLNNVTCKFSDPSKPYVKYLPYPNRTFYPISFQVFTTQTESITVGQSFILGLNIRSIGLIFSNYTANVSVLPNLQGTIPAIVENPVSNTSVLKYNEIGRLNPKITFLSAEKANIKVLTRSNVDPITCIDDTDCTSYGSGAQCIDIKCWKMNIVEIAAGTASLPDFNWTGLLQIMILSAITILIVGFKRKIK